jgi:glucose/arabinose dehydrogenase/PKD repeat protein
MRVAGLVVAVIAVGLFSIVLPAAPAGAVVPAGFTDQLVTSVGGPTALAFTPDNRMLVTTQSGTVRVVENGALQATPALSLTSTICANSERGLLGVAVDPAFATNGFVFLYYSFNRAGDCGSGTVNRVSRFVMTGNSLGGEVVLVDNIPSPAGNHNAGDLQFGKEGMLYVSVGDGGCDYPGGTPSGCAGSNDAARDRHSLVGKILRIDRDGGVPADNPFTGAGTARCRAGNIASGLVCQETFAWGLRNPFRIALDPNAPGTRFHLNDVGQNAWEEIDLLAAGADYGWNVREGHCATGSTTSCGPPPAGMTNPVFDYGRSDGCASITGGAFVPNGTWPAEYQGKYLFADYVCGKIFRLDPNGSGGFTRVDFATGLGGSSAVHMRFGPANGGQALYYTSYAGGGQIRRIVHTAANNPPTAAIQGTPTSGPAPLTVSFSGSGSFDPEGGALSYEWTFGDGTPPVTTTASTATHTYAAGSSTASLVVIDPQGARSSPATIQITSGQNTAPTASVSAPATFRVGDTITVTGSATDAQDATLPDSAFSWTVLRHHATHTHPWASGTGRSLSFPAPAPEDLAAATNSYVEVILTVRDSGGLTGTARRDVQPRKVQLTVATAPTGLRVLVNGTAFTGPATFTSWEGWSVTLDAPTPQKKFSFSSWSDGGARVHPVVTPATARTYTATFVKGRR